jgi:hypothetical protein
MFIILPKFNFTPSYCSLMGLGQCTQLRGTSIMSKARIKY